MRDQLLVACALVGVLAPSCARVLAYIMSLPFNRHMQKLTIPIMGLLRIPQQPHKLWFLRHGCCPPRSCTKFTHVSHN